MKKHGVTAFYLETLVLITVFLGVILVLSQVFGAARSQSERAGEMTAAVHLAEQAAEAVAASDSLEAVKDLLIEEGSADISGEILEVESGGLLARVTWEPEGGLIRSHITVYRGEDEIYALETAVRGEGTL